MRMITIRYAQVSDAKSLAEIHVNSWKSAYRGIIPDEVLDHLSIERREAYFKKILLENSQSNAILFVDDAAAGLICLGQCRDTDKNEAIGEIQAIYLLPDFWNKGLGYRLMNWGINELKKRKYTDIVLWVLDGNHRAKKFYEKIGFRHDGMIKEISIGKLLSEFRYTKSV